MIWCESAKVNNSAGVHVIVGYPDANVGEQRVGVRLSLRSSSIIFPSVTRSLFKRPFQLQYSCLAPNLVSVGPNRRATTAPQSPNIVCGASFGASSRG